MIPLDRSELSNATWSLTSRGVHNSVVAEWGDRNAGRLEKVTVGEGEPVKYLRHPFPTEEEALAAARAELNRSQRSGGHLDLVLGGFRPEILAGGKVLVNGLRPELSGNWLVTKVTHTLEAALTTQIQTERKPPG